ncbi:MAG: GIY-YIG nuclease family protein [Verrucomicrobiota bacterium]
MEDHNAGRNVSTKAFRPWKLEMYLAFSDREKALGFERYLKTASGKAFADKRLR